MGNILDYATSTVATAPSPATSGTSLTVASGHGSRFPATPFSVTAHPANEMPTLDNSEKLTVTNKSGDVFTITRAQGDTTAKSIADGWMITNALFKDDLDAKAEDSTVVKLSGNQTIAGSKTFTGYTTLSGGLNMENTSIENVQYPARGDMAASKDYVDGIVPTSLDDIAEGSTNKYFTSTEKSKLSGIEAGAQVNTVTSVAGRTGAVTLVKGDVGLGNVDNTSNATERAAAATLTNKRINPRTVSAASATSVTPTIATYDQYIYTALAANLTINAPTGTPVNGNKLLFAIKDNGTSRTLTWNAAFAAAGIAMPTLTTVSKWHYIGFIYNATAAKWHCIAATKES